MKKIVIISLAAGLIVNTFNVAMASNNEEEVSTHIGDVVLESNLGEETEPIKGAIIIVDENDVVIESHMFDNVNELYQYQLEQEAITIAP